MAEESAIRDLVQKMTAERGKLLGQIEALTEKEAEEVPQDAEGEAQWTAKEQCAHVAEMETGYRAWVEQALAQDNPDLTDVRGGPVAVPLQEANKHPLPRLVAELRRQRNETLKVIEQLRPKDYDRRATSPMFGTLTILQWLRSYYRHDRMHQAQIAGRKSEYKPHFIKGEPDQRRSSPL